VDADGGYEMLPEVVEGRYGGIGQGSGGERRRERGKVARKSLREADPEGMRDRTWSW
jgi:hypothetical protein